MHRWQYYKAFFVLLDEAVHRFILVLVVAYFLADAAEVQTDGRIADDHLK